MKINKTKNMVIGRKPKKVTCELKINPTKKWIASNTWGVIAVAT